MTALALFSTLCMLISMACCVVAVAALRSLRAFASSRPQKRLSDLELSQAELASTLESVTLSLKRLSSRQGMRELRARRADEAPPATKEEARARYLRGRSHAEIARMAMNGVHAEGDRE